MDMQYKLLQDYTPTPFQAVHVDLDVSIQADSTIVSNRTQYTCKDVSKNHDLFLNGEQLTLLQVTLTTPHGVVKDLDYELTAKGLTIKRPPHIFVLTVVTQLFPEKNLSLEGLYTSSGMLCTQCEAEGFRKITYFYDRPDVMATYTVRIEAEADTYPVLLSNGNLVDQGKSGTRHWIVWQDPFPKPCYLFALVAGNLACLKDTFVTSSGLKVSLEIYSDHKSIHACGHAMDSLKQSMKWDEERFHLECDLNSYKIVAVGDFNAGAMENKGLNIFNTIYVLAEPETATDLDYDGIAGVIGHEYFHNWTGNRITCRDWFQLCLKEGLTVFRDQEFSASLGSAVVERIQEVRSLKTYQFPEDQGPMAHPPRPNKYMEINNFYTPTVYRKGAEIVRMIHTVLGEEAFQKGMKTYIQRHDGQAVTQEDFIQALSDGSHRDLSRFMDWYNEAGTPTVRVSGEYDAQAKTFTLHFAQHFAQHPAQYNHPPCTPKWLPVSFGLLDAHTGQPVVIHGLRETQGLLHVTQETQSFCIENIHQPVLPSLFRNFSAPVKWSYDYSKADKILLLNRDTDAFNSWDAAQSLFLESLQELAHTQDEQSLDPLFIDALGQYLHADRFDLHVKALSLTPPSDALICQSMCPIHIEGLNFAKTTLQRVLGDRLQNILWKEYETHHEVGPYAYTPAAKAKRAYKNMCLMYLAATNTQACWDVVLQQLKQAQNMTDVSAALSLISQSHLEQRSELLEAFYLKWQDNPLMVDKWFAMQARARRPEVLEDIKQLLTHRAFQKTNPNRLRSLLGVFCRDNIVGFHHISGEGYRLCAEYVLQIDPLNPQMAANLAGNLGRWREFDVTRQGLMCEALRFIQKSSNLSPDVSEIITKSINLKPG